MISNRTALHGTEALAIVLAYNEESREEADRELDLLIMRVYARGSALASLGRPAAVAPTIRPVLQP